MGGTFFTSDLHLGHARVAEIRGFESVDNHDEVILNNLATTCSREDDILWLLGDVTGGSTRAEKQALEDLADLPCRKRLIFGNHDSGHPSHRDAHKGFRAYLDVFEYAASSARVKLAGQSVVLSHYPYEGDHTEEDRDVQWRLRDQGEWLLHGHTHWEARRSWHPRQIHVGLDAWNLMPAPASELERIITSQLAADNEVEA